MVPVVVVPVMEVMAVMVVMAAVVVMVAAMVVVATAVTTGRRRARRSERSNSERDSGDGSGEDLTVHCTFSRFQPGRPSPRVCPGCAPGPANAM